MGCSVLWQIVLGRDITSDEFGFCYRPAQRGEGFWYFSAREKGLDLVQGLPSSHKSWKDKFFFVGGKGWEFQPWETDLSVRVPLEWGRPGSRGMSSAQ